VTDAATGALRALPARRIVAAIASAAARWCDADFPPRVRATAEIGARTSYTEPVVDYALDRLFGALSEGALLAAISGELGSLAALDGFVPRSGRADGYAAPVGSVGIVASDTTIGVALPAAAFALCAKCDVSVRDRSDSLCAAFAETLAVEDPAFVRALRVHPAAAHDDDAWLAELGGADAVVAFGGDRALRAIRERTAPQARFIAYGHRTSAGYVARDALSGDVAAIAAGAARDALLYDGEGCMSLHAVFVERGGALDPAQFAAALARALERAAVEFPARDVRPAPAVAGYRDASLFRSALGKGATYTAPGAPHLLVVEPPRDEPPPLLPRTIALYAVDGPAEMVAFVRAHRLPLEAMAVADPVGRRDVLDAVVASGAVRIAPFGALQAPSLADEHGGIVRISEFVRWVTREP
jgi:hypothetical protein